MTEEKEAAEHDGEREEGVDVKERHRSVEREFHPKREGRPRFAFPEISFAPLPKQKQTRRDGVKQPALGNKHGERQALPGNGFIALVIDQASGGEEAKPGYT